MSKKQWTVNDMVDMSDKIVLVTGGNGGKYRHGLNGSYLLTGIYFRYRLCLLQENAREKCQGLCRCSRF